MVDLSWPKDSEFSEETIEKLNNEYLSWGRFMPEESGWNLEERKAEVCEKARLTLEEKGIEINTLKLEWVVCEFAGTIDPLDFSFFVGLKEVDS